MSWVKRGQLYSTLRPTLHLDAAHALLTIYWHVTRRAAKNLVHENSTPLHYIYPTWAEWTRACALSANSARLLPGLLTLYTFLHTYSTDLTVELHSAHTPLTLCSSSTHLLLVERRRVDWVYENATLLYSIYASCADWARAWAHSPWPLLMCVVVKQVSVVCIF